MRMFRCRECDAAVPRWEGRCPRCLAWGTVEPDRRGERDRGGAEAAVRPRPLSEILARPVERRSTGSEELDRVLGGGAVPGTAVLLGGEPGIGKSTLLLMVSARAKGRTLYVAGEESPEQVAVRARRLGIDREDLGILDRTETGEIIAAIERERPDFVVVDSVQSVRTDEVRGAPGGPSQVRAAAARLVPVARATGAALFLVGQMTKVGGIAGPRFLEHAVDVVLLFEGDRNLGFRAIRVAKNRYGATDEIGLFEMRDDGLWEVRDGSGLLLAGRSEGGPGSVVAAVVEGRRALCVEVQALLVGERRIPGRRRAQGVEPRRVEVLVGVVESLFARSVAERDVFANVVGGIEVHDTGLDLAVAAAVLGAESGSSVPADAVVFGEVGLRGEVRGVSRVEARLKEARAMGFRRAFLPRGSPHLEGIACVEVDRVDEVLLRPDDPRDGYPRRDARGAPQAAEGVVQRPEREGGVLNGGERQGGGGGTCRLQA